MQPVECHGHSQAQPRCCLAGVPGWGLACGSLLLHAGARRVLHQRQIFAFLIHRAQDQWHSHALKNHGMTSALGREAESLCCAKQPHACAACYCLRMGDTLSCRCLLSSYDEHLIAMHCRTSCARASWQHSPSDTDTVKKPYFAALQHYSIPTRVLHPCLTRSWRLETTFGLHSFRKQGLSRVVANPSKVSVSFTTQQTRFSQILFTAASCEYLRYRVV